MGRVDDSAKEDCKAKCEWEPELGELIQLHGWFHSQLPLYHLIIYTFAQPSQLTLATWPQPLYQEILTRCTRDSLRSLLRYRFPFPSDFANNSCNNNTKNQYISFRRVEKGKMQTTVKHRTSWGEKILIALLSTSLKTTRLYLRPNEEKPWCDGRGKIT